MTSASGTASGGSALDDVRVDKAMTSRVASCRPDWSLAAVGRKMANAGIHCLVVAGIVRRGGREQLTWGIVSDQDVSASASRATVTEPPRRLHARKWPPWSPGAASGTPPD